MKLFGCLDYTSLNATDSDASIAELCRKALKMRIDGGVHVAGVCVYPRFVARAADILKGSGVRVVSVASDFPHGQSSLSQKQSDMLALEKEGADEVDVVINRGLILQGRYDEASNELLQQKRMLNKSKMKVILETCELGSPKLVKTAAQVAIDGGADFIKTSTGKGSAGTTLEVAEIMLKVIKANLKKTKNIVGFKVAGGVKTPEEAVEYARLAINIMGEEFIDSHTFRIGTSSLTEPLFSLLTF